MDLDIEVHSFPLAKPFVITGHRFESTETIRVTLEHGGISGRGEAVGSYYLNETTAGMMQTLGAVAADLHALPAKLPTPEEIQEQVQDMLPPGGARNALDCALWDYRAKVAGRRIWDLLGLEPVPLSTVYTLGIDEPEAMAAHAREAARYPKLKIKLDADRPVERLEAIRRVRPDAELIIDVNQGWDFAMLREYVPHCERLGVAMIEQPLPRGEDEALEGFRSPLPLGADESCLHLGEFPEAARRYQVLNIKLDKCGGLTEALRLVEAARREGMQIMVGNMMGSSLSMAPSFVIGQYCRFVDIDGPLLLARDVEHGLSYSSDGRVSPPAVALWG